MKFGKHLLKQQLPEWAAHYMNYKALKKKIKAAETTQDAAEINAAKKAFFFSLDRELEKVNAFYVGKESELRTRLRLLLEKKKVMTSNPRRNSEALQNFHDAFMLFQHELIKLQNFVEINGTGFRKILKKFDRRTKATTKEMYLTSHVDVQPCFNREILADLADIAATHLSELNHFLRDVNDHKISFEQWMKNADYLEHDLFKAVADDNIPTMTDLVAQLRNLEVDHDHDWLNRAFRRACVSGRVSAAQFLISNGADVSAVNDVSGRSCLHEAAINGHFHIIKLLVEQGVDFNLEDMHGRRPLHYVVMGNHLECVKYLLDKGATVSTMDQDGTTPLVFAMMNGHVNCARILLEHSQPSEALVDGIGRSHIGLACQYGHEAIALMLIERGAQVNDVNAEGLTPLHLSCRGGHAECVRVLTSHGADVSAIDKDNQWTPLFFAASEGHAQCVEVLLAAGAKVDVLDESGWTPWQFALYAGHIETALLIKNAASQIDNGLAKQPAAPAKDVSEAAAQAADDLPLSDLDGIPSLALPPPIIPIKIYGHNYLNNKVQVQIRLGSSNLPPLRLVDARQSSLKLNISAKPDIGIPHTVVLPLEDDHETFTFVVDALDKLMLQFDIMPMFGSKVIGRAIALPSVFEAALFSSKGSVQLPLFDTYLELIGELSFEFIVIQPFLQAALTVGGKVKTYWKTTTVLSPRPTEVHRPLKSNSTVVTASSLVQEYILLNVVVTRDLVPVIFSGWTLEGTGFDLCINDVSLAQIQGLSRDNKRKISDNAEEPVALDSYVTLQQALTSIRTSVGICLEINYPSEEEKKQQRISNLPDPNSFIDAILKTVYEVAETRSMMFCSSDPQICLTINLKQPNFPVLFRTWAGLKHSSDARCNSIHQAVRFAKAANLLGIVCEATPLVQVPALIPAIKEEGLILASFGDANRDSTNVATQTTMGIDAILVGKQIQLVKTQQWF